MSILFGLFYREGKPVEDELVTMYGEMKHFPHENHAFAVQGNCGFGHMLIYNTPEAVNECMPKWLEEQKLLFVAEGRIDNRDELFTSFAIPANERTTIPDGDLILKAYQKWGEQCVDKLLGKWSLAAFHTDRQSLFIARDKCDYTAIDYYEDDTVFAFSTSSKGLFPLPFIKKELDELMLARLLYTWPGDPDKTYLKGIRRLLPAHFIKITGEKSVLSHYWDPADIRVCKDLTFEEHIDRLSDNLNKAVKCRLRSYKPIAATLSGGMDSSTVCVLAAEQLAQQRKRLRTYSHVPRFSPSGILSDHQFGNERPFIEAVVEASGNIDAAFLDSADLSPIDGIKEAIRLYGEPFYGTSNAYWMVDIFNTAVNENYGTLLMGVMGNATISWKGIEEILPVGEIVKRYGVKSAIKKKLLSPLLYGTFLSGIYRRILLERESWRSRIFCTESFGKSLNIVKRIRAAGFDPTYSPYLRSPKQKAVRISGFNSLRHPRGAYLGCEIGLELRDPTGDVRVFESALSIPNEMYFGEMKKWVLRTMMKGRLPEKVRLNTKKGVQSSDLTARVCAYPEEMESMLNEIKNSGFNRIADIKRIRTEWPKMKADCNNYPNYKTAAILRVIAAYEFWKEYN